MTGTKAGNPLPESGVIGHNRKALVEAILSSGHDAASLSLHNNFRPEPVSMDWVRKEFDSRTKLRYAGNGKYTLRIHSNQWYDFYSPVDPNTFTTKRNPRSSADDMYESFHGEPSDETVEFEEQEHYHSNLAALGELVELKVKLVGGGTAVIGFEDTGGDETDNPGGTRYRGVITAIPGHLLCGGKKKVVSSWFDSKKEAHDWVYAMEQPGIETHHIERGGPVGKKANPFWPFNSFTKTTIYHIDGTKYSTTATHKGYKIYKQPTGEFVVPKLDAESRFDTKKDAVKFIDSWKKARPNPVSGKEYIDFLENKIRVLESAQPFTSSKADKMASENLRAYRAELQHYLRTGEKKLNPKHHPGPFSSAGKLVGSLSRAASRPVDDVFDATGKIGGYLDDQLGRVLNPGTDFSLFDAAKKADDEFQHALESEYGKRAGDMRYQSRKHPAHIKALAEKKHKADGLWLKEMRRKKNPSDHGPVYLTSNESGTQLHITGGDQSLDLPGLGITGPEAEKELVTIGTVTDVVYHATKIFDGKTETYDYSHHFSEDSRGPRPTLLYDRLNSSLKLAGGVYHIPRPMIGTSSGIND